MVNDNNLPPTAGVVDNDSRAEGEAIVMLDEPEARLSNEPKASETVNIRPSGARGMVIIIVDDGGGE